MFASTKTLAMTLVGCLNSRNNFAHKKILTYADKCLCLSWYCEDTIASDTLTSIDPWLDFLPKVKKVVVASIIISTILFDMICTIC